MNPEARADVACVIGCVQPNVSICATVSRAAIGFVGFLSAQRFPARLGYFFHLPCCVRGTISDHARALGRVRRALILARNMASFSIVRLTCS